MNPNTYTRNRAPQSIGNLVFWPPAERTWQFHRTACFGICILLYFTTSAHALFPDTLGLKWGLELSDFRQMNVVIEDEWPIWNRATAIRLDEKSQALNNEGSFILVFDEEFGLVKTHWASKPIERDANGRKGMHTFKELKAQLSKQYGIPQEIHEEPSVKLQGFHGEFYQCLQEETCGQWQSIWETPEGGVLILELVGLDPGVGFMQMTHQGPNLTNALTQTTQEGDSLEHEI